MKLSRIATLMAAIALAGLLPSGCDRHASGDGHDHGKSDGHAHGEETAGGASFKPGKGVLLTDETRQSLGVETADVTERKLPLELRFVAQVFGEDHQPTATETHHAECTAKAAGLLAQDKAVPVRPADPVQLATKSGEPLSGVVLGINKAPAIGDVEVLVGITNAAARLKPGEFLSATITLPRQESVLVVRKSAVLSSAEGTFVYTVNGDAYFRTTVQTGAEAEGFVEIKDGLLMGDVVVTKPVEKLWLIELRATKGGGHSH